MGQVLHGSATTTEAVRQSLFHILFSSIIIYFIISLFISVLKRAPAQPRSNAATSSRCGDQRN
jgi:hypothetical protein